MPSWVKTIDDFSPPETYITPYYTIKSHGQEEASRSVPAQLSVSSYQSVW